MQLGNAVTLHNDTFNMIELQTLLHYIVFSAATIIVSAVGDLVCAHNSLARFPWLRAASDNATHGLVAAFCWIMVSGRPISAESLRDTLLCALVACALDIDHFIAAASFQIRDATSLVSRPYLHCTSVVMFCIFLVMAASRLGGHRQIQKLTVIASVAVTSHHLRDSLRRGLWLWPLGSTSPVKLQYYYAGLVCIVIAASLWTQSKLQHVPQGTILRLV